MKSLWVFTDCQSAFVHPYISSLVVDPFARDGFSPIWKGPQFPNSILRECIRFPSHRMFLVLKFNGFHLVSGLFWTWHVPMKKNELQPRHASRNPVRFIQGSIVTIAWIDRDPQSKHCFGSRNTPSLTQLKMTVQSWEFRDPPEDRWIGPCHQTLEMKTFLSRRQLFWFPLLFWVNWKAFDPHV